jgi:hypothetical protein
MPDIAHAPHPPPARHRHRTPKVPYVGWLHSLRAAAAAASRGRVGSQKVRSACLFIPTRYSDARAHASRALQADPTKRARLFDRRGIEARLRGRRTCKNKNPPPTHNRWLRARKRQGTPARATIPVGCRRRASPRSRPCSMGFAPAASATSSSSMVDARGFSAAAPVAENDRSDENIGRSETPFSPHFRKSLNTTPTRLLHLNLGKP